MWPVYFSSSSGPAQKERTVRMLLRVCVAAPWASEMYLRRLFENLRLVGGRVFLRGYLPFFRGPANFWQIIKTIEFIGHFCKLSYKEEKLQEEDDNLMK